YLNAIQAMAASPQRVIRVSTRREGTQAVLRIEDTGPGLASESAAQVGTAFFSTKEQGLGVGLSISRAIAEQHGGALSIDNGPEGGARVTLRLPSLA
ncbi:MAG TPA: ATP-binding protein, partial [Aquabacterium sp.]|nr:ATP-binding protein [Aquabacterium sp.]